VIRPYQPADRDALLDCWEAAARGAHAFLDDAFFDAERTAIRDEYLPTTETSVYVADDTVVGFIALLGDEIGGLFVHPSWQRRGIGRALVEHARQTRCVLAVDVFERNVASVAFYERIGFVTMGRHTHAATGEVLQRMQLAPSA
jgi:putative acetyltransferase